MHIFFTNLLVCLHKTNLSTKFTHDLKYFKQRKNKNGLVQLNTFCFLRPNVLTNSVAFVFTNTTAQLAHSQCPLVQRDSTTSPHILSYGIMSFLRLTFKSMEKPFAQPMLIGVPPLSQIMVTHHAVGSLSLLK